MSNGSAPLRNSGFVFTRARRQLAQVLPIAVCLSVRPSICHKSVFYTEMAKYMNMMMDYINVRPKADV